MGARRLNDSLWHIETGSPYDCHVYLADGGTEAALIDCGTGLATAELLAAVAETGCLDRLDRVLLTHYHADHAGGAAGLRAARGVRVLASAETAAVLGTGDAVFQGGRVSIQPIPDCRPHLYARTAERLAGLPVDMLLPGHLELVLDGGAAHLATAAAYFRRLATPPNIVSTQPP